MLRLVLRVESRVRFAYGWDVVACGMELMQKNGFHRTRRELIYMSYRYRLSHCEIAGVRFTTDQLICVCVLACLTRTAHMPPISFAAAAAIESIEQTIVGVYTTLTIASKRVFA